jgi:valyl-tRNA synthetase
MQPQMAIRIDKSTRKHFPDGISSYGTDALRFTFASLASTGRDVRFDLGRIEGYRNFCNKLWNAARFVLMNTEHQDCGLDGGKLNYSLADRWIQSRLQTVGQSMIDSINAYRLDLAAQQIYEFLWNEYCDWYLEFAKINLQQADEESVRGTRKTLVQVLENVLRLLHPLMPFITEEIWQRIAPLAGIKGKTIVVEPYPVPNHQRVDTDSIAEVEWIMAFILGLRRIRGEMNISPGKPVPVLLENTSPLDRERLERNNETLRKLGRIESTQLLGSGDQAPDSAIALVDQMRVLIPMSGLIDKEAELERIAKETEKLKKALPRIEGKLNNLGFLAKAPEQVVEKEKARLKQLQVALENLEQQSRQIKAI